jgi:hypothetical protein
MAARKSHRRKAHASDIKVCKVVKGKVKCRSVSERHLGGLGRKPKRNAKGQFAKRR